MRIVCHADSGPEVGVGHVMRTITLANELRRRGHDVTIVAADMPSFASRRLDGVRWEKEAPSSETTEPPDCVVVDGYRLGATVRAAHRSSSVVAVIDDNRELPTDLADVVVNQNLHAESVVYVGGTSTTYLLGPRYALLRSELSEAGTTSDPTAALVAMGGTDPGRFTAAIARRWQQDPSVGEVRLELALAASHPDHAELVELVRSAPTRLTFADPTLVGAISNSCAAIIGGGTTMWELAAVGLPAVVAIVADNQEAGSRAAAQRGFVKVVDCRRQPPDVAAQLLVDELQQLVADPAERRRMVGAGRELFDFDGPARISQVLEREVMRRTAP